MSARHEVGKVRLDVNEVIADALLPSIFAGHLMFSSAPKDQVIDEFVERVSRSSSAAAPALSDSPTTPPNG